MDKRISVIIPAYNSENTIKRCLRSVFNGDYRNFEVILVDDCSTDKTAEIARQFSCKIILSSQRRGPGFSRDRGISLADGEVVAFLDSDCIAPRDWLFKINNKITTDMVGLGGKYALPVRLNIFSKIFLTYMDPKSVFYRKILEVISFSGGNCAFWKFRLMQDRDKKELSCCNKITGGEDTIMCCELQKFGKLIYDPDLVVVHDKADFPIKILTSAVRYGYTGAIVSTVCGNLLAKDICRVYKAIIYLISVSICVLLPFFHFAPVRALFLWFLMIYLLLESPLFIYGFNQLSMRFSLPLMPLCTFSMDIFYFIGHIKRIFAVIAGKIKTTIWNIKFLFNIFNSGAVSRVFFFATSKCNANCYFCFNKEDRDVYQKEADLSLAEIKSMTQTMGFLPWLTITGGEPFLRDDFYEICEYFYYNCGTRIISVVTNGILWPKIGDAVEKLLIDFRDLNLTVIVALDDIGEKHDSIKGVCNCYPYALNSLKQLSTLKSRFPRLTVGINTMLLKENIGHIDAILGHFVNNFSHDRQALNLQRQSACTSNEPGLILIEDYFDLVRKSNKELAGKRPLLGKKFSEALLEYCIEKSLWEFRNKKPYSTCLAARKFFVINNSGDVYPCELLLEKIGSLRREGYDFEKISKGETAEDIKKKIKNTGCYCQWPCAVVNNTLFNFSSYGRLFKRSVLAACEESSIRS